jgi:pSer/pThr/pTyr-binding forkhead associated (FHA) protein
VLSSGAILPIPAGKTVALIGREDPVSGIFPEIDLDPHGGQDAGVGRRHAQLLLQGGQLFIEDLNSVNGTAVNKQKVASGQLCPLNPGDEIRLGKMTLVYQVG